METENPKKAYGALKPCASYAPMNVMLGVYRVFELGAKKYGQKNFRKQSVDISTYYNAAQRHLIEFFELCIDADPESGQSPLAHVIACCMIILDGIERGEIKDDRAFTEVLIGKMVESTDETLRKNLAYAGGDVPLPAQPQMDTSTDNPMLLSKTAARPPVVPDFKTSGFVAEPRRAPKDF